MFNEIREKWDKYGFEIILISCIIFICIYGLYRRIRGKNGSWSSIDYTRPTIYKPPKKAPRIKRKAKESKGEGECRKVIERVFNKSFPSIRPDFLSNPVTGGNFNLELDCYNSGLRLAIEYNGRQHYYYIPFFHKNKEAFLNQKYRDDMKRRICKDNGITLIEVPYTVKIKDIESYLIKEIRKAGYKI
jgi:hypothetical protein